MIKEVCLYCLDDVNGFQYHQHRRSCCCLLFRGLCCCCCWTRGVLSWWSCWLDVLCLRVGETGILDLLKLGTLPPRFSLLLLFRPSGESL